MKSILILGAGGHGKVVADTLSALEKNWQLAFLDDRFPELSEVSSREVIGRTDQLESFRDDYTDVAVAIGDNETRLDYVRQALALGYRVPTIIHPSAYVCPVAKLGVGTVVFAGAVVQPDANLGMACIVNTGATIDHDCSLGDGVHLSPGASLGGGVEVGDCTWIGIGASVREYASLGSRVIVGAGAAVVSDFDDEVVVTGVPAQVNTNLRYKVKNDGAS